MAAGALHQSHFINTEDTDSNHSVGRPMRASALSIEIEAAPTGNNRIETGVTQNNVAPTGELSTASFFSSSFGYSPALDGTLRRILHQDSNDIVPWCNVALRRVRETRHRHDDFGVNSRVSFRVECGTLRKGGMCCGDRFGTMLAEVADPDLGTHFRYYLRTRFAVFQLPTISAPTVAPSAMSVRRDSPRHMTELPGGGSLARAR